MRGARSQPSLDRREGHQAHPWLNSLWVLQVYKGWSWRSSWLRGLRMGGTHTRLRFPVSSSSSVHRGDGGEQVGRVHRLWNVKLESRHERLATVLRPGVRRQRDRRDLATAVERQHPY